MSLRRDMTWGEALDALQRAAHTAIVYPKAGDKEIGVSVTARPWREALDILVGANGLQVAEREGYLELTSPVASGPAGPAPTYNLNSRQVEINAVFFVADWSTLRELGIDWGTMGGNVATALNPASALAALSDSSKTGGAAQAAGSSSVSEWALRAAAGGRTTINGHQVSGDALIKTLENKNLGKVIAAPQITVVDGQEGVVFIGRDFATTVTDFAGNAITKFQSTGISLKVTPHLFTESGVTFIHLAMETERSSLIDPVQQIIDKTNASTQVLLFDGEETAMAGLVQSEVTHLRKGIPFLKDLPPWFFGMRYLFGYERYQDVERELVILLQARLAPTIQDRIQAKIAAPPGSESEGEAPGIPEDAPG